MPHVPADERDIMAALLRTAPPPKADDKGKRKAKAGRPAKKR